MAIALPKDLIEAVKNDRCGLYIGAGVSAGAGLPDWPTLLSDLISIAKDTARLTPEKEAELRAMSSNPARYLMVAEELKEILPSELRAHIKKTFDSKAVQPTDAHRALLDLKHRFIITTNYDTLIERAYITKTSDFPSILSYKDAASINYNLVNGEYFILKAHGDAKNTPEEIILTERDYRNIIYNQRGYQSVLQIMFSFYNIIFLGTSLNDPELNLLLGFIHNIFHGGSPKHYALISNDKVNQTEADRWRKDFNINVITYDPKDRHAELTQFIKELRDATV